MTNRASPLLKLDRTINFVNEIFRIVEGDGSESRAVDLLLDAERAANLEVTVIAPFPPLMALPDELYHGQVEGLFYDFLSATNLILGAAEASRIRVIFPDGHVYGWGMREWGHTIAKWANQVSWLGRNDWHFGEFTGGPSDATIENYNLWSATAMRILKLKCQNQIDSVEQLIPELRDQLLKNPNKQIRLAAATTLGSLGTHEAKSALQKAIGTETDDVILTDIRYYLSLPDF